MAKPEVLVTREEWHEASGLTRHQEMRHAQRWEAGPLFAPSTAPMRERVLLSTDDRLRVAEAALGVVLRPGTGLGEYVEDHTAQVLAVGVPE